MNYTVEHVETLKSYPEKGVEELATMTGHSTRSVIAKLAQMGLYEAKQRAKGEARVTKADLVKAIAKKVGLEDASVLKSLEKAEKSALETLAKIV